MNKIKLIGIITVIVFLIASVVTANVLIEKNRKLKAEILRVQTNNLQLMSENRENINLTLSFKEFKASMSTKIDSILKVAEIASKRVKTVTTINNYYIDSSRTIIRPDPVISKNDTLYPFIDIKDCFSIKGFMQVVADKPELTIQERKFNNEINVIVHNKRPHKIWFVRWGKREMKIEGVSDCGEVKIKQVNIIK
jgi:hypothetical protein